MSSVSISAMAVLPNVILNRIMVNDQKNTHSYASRQSCFEAEGFHFCLESSSSSSSINRNYGMRMLKCRISAYFCPLPATEACLGVHSA